MSLQKLILTFSKFSCPLPIKQPNYTFLYSTDELNNSKLNLQRVKEEVFYLFNFINEVIDNDQLKNKLLQRQR